MNSAQQSLIDTATRCGWRTKKTSRGGLMLSGPDGLTIMTADPRTANESDYRDLRTALKRNGITVMDGVRVNRSVEAFTLPDPSGDPLELVAPNTWEVARAVESLAEMMDVVGEEVASLRKQIAEARQQSESSITAQANLISEIRGIVYKVREDLGRQSAAQVQHLDGHLTADDLSRSHAHCVTPADLKRVADALEEAIHQQVAQVDPVAALRAKMRGTA